MPPLIVAGLVLLLAGKSWFAGAATVGWICLAVGIAPVVFFLIVLALGAIGIAVFDRK